MVIALGSARRVWILWCGCGAEDGCVGGGLDSGAAEATFFSYASYTKEGVTLVDRSQIAQPEEAELKCCQRCYDFVTLKLPGMEVKEVVAKAHNDEGLKSEIHEALSRTEPLPDLDVSAIDGVSGEVVTSYALLTKKQVIARFGRTPKFLRMKEVDLKTKPGGSKATYYAVRPRDERYPVLRLARTFAVQAKKRKLAANTSVFPRQGELLLEAHGEELLRDSSLLSMERVATFDTLDQRAHKTAPSKDDGVGHEESDAAEDSDGGSDAMDSDAGEEVLGDLGLHSDDTRRNQSGPMRSKAKAVSLREASATLAGSADCESEGAADREGVATASMKPSPAKTVTPKASLAKLAPSNAVRSSPNEAPKKGTPEYWIARSNLDDIVDGLITTGHQESQIEILLPKLSDTDRRRLNAHWVHIKDAKHLKEGQHAVLGEERPRCQCDESHARRLDVAAIFEVTLCIGFL